MKYSIIYAVTRPEIKERLSVGIIITDGEKIEMRYSQDKLDVLRPLFSEKEYDFLQRVVKSMNTTRSVESVEGVNYLTRYSNNLITVSPLESIDIEDTEQNRDWLFRNYVFDRERVSA